MLLARDPHAHFAAVRQGTQVHAPRILGLQRASSAPLSQFVQLGVPLGTLTLSLHVNVEARSRVPLPLSRLFLQPLLTPDQEASLSAGQ